MPIVPTYKRDLQAYAGIYDETGTQALTTSLAQLTTWSAATGPSALNCTVAADFDDITVAEGGIYLLHFEGNWHTAAAHTLTVAIRDDGTSIHEQDSMSVTETASQFQAISLTTVAEVAAGSVLDIAVKSASGTPTLTLNDAKFWVVKLAPRP